MNLAGMDISANKNLEGDECQSRENLFGFCSLSMNDMYIIFP